MSSGGLSCRLVSSDLVCVVSKTPRDVEIKLPGSEARRSHMVSQLGREAGAQVTCFCAASWAVTDPSLKLASCLPDRWLRGPSRSGFRCCCTSLTFPFLLVCHSNVFVRGQDGTDEEGMWH